MAYVYILFHLLVELFLCCKHATATVKQDSKCLTIDFGSFLFSFNLREKAVPEWNQEKK